MIRFDEVNHKYYDGEKELISVTTLMRKHGLAPDYSSVSQEVLNKKAERGTLIHKEIENFNKEGIVGFTKECNEFAGYTFINNVKVISSEQIVHNDIVAGTLDLILDYGNGFLTIADIKTTATLHKEAVSWQLSIYAYLVNDPRVIKGQAYHFNKDGELKVVDIPLKPMEEVEKLMEAERNGFELYHLPQIELDEEQIATIKEATAIIEKAKAEQKSAEDRLTAVKESLLVAMQENGVKKFQSDNLTITYVDEVEKVTIDSARLKKEMPEIAEQYSKKTIQKASVRITLKEPKNE